jgi:quercetin 2,3-dioxygenase
MSHPGTRGEISRSTDCLPLAGRPVLERIATRNAEVGDDLTVRRALPNRQRRMVGAWCFLDHAGPVDYVEGRGLTVGPHPHIGLQTFTWMIEGEVVHRDSLGNEQTIRPGQVNLMTAGHGISHAEDSPGGRGGRLHAVQLWIALDEAHRNGPPAFHHHPLLPVVERDGFHATLLVGTASGETSPVAVFSPLAGIDLTARSAVAARLPLERRFEYAALVLVGEMAIEGEPFAPGKLCYLGAGRESLSLQSRGAAHLVLIGGEPFGEEILLWWNFVARTPGELQTAVSDWNARRRFGTVHGSPSHPLVAPDIAGLRLQPPRA